MTKDKRMNDLPVSDEVVPSESVPMGQIRVAYEQRLQMLRERQSKSGGTMSRWDFQLRDALRRRDANDLRTRMNTVTEHTWQRPGGIRDTAQNLLDLLPEMEQAVENFPLLHRLAYTMALEPLLGLVNDLDFELKLLNKKIQRVKDSYGEREDTFPIIGYRDLFLDFRACSSLLQMKSPSFPVIVEQFRELEEHLRKNEAAGERSQELVKERYVNVAWKYDKLMDMLRDIVSPQKLDDLRRPPYRDGEGYLQQVKSIAELIRVMLAENAVEA